MLKCNRKPVVSKNHFKFASAFDLKNLLYRLNCRFLSVSILYKYHDRLKNVLQTLFLYHVGCEQGGKQTQFLGQTAPPSSDENRQFPNFNPWNKNFQTKKKERILLRNKSSDVSAYIILFYNVKNCTKKGWSPQLSVVRERVFSEVPHRPPSAHAHLVQRPRQLQVDQTEGRKSAILWINNESEKIGGGPAFFGDNFRHKNLYRQIP